MLRLPVDAPDLPAQLAAAIGARHPVPPEVIVIIPSDQVFYMSHPGHVAPNELRWLLDGRTPYPVSALRLDWHSAPDHIQLAAIPVAVLREAEAYVTALGLHPVGVAASPGDDRFDGTPWFGRAIDPAPYGASPESDGKDVVDLLPGSTRDPRPLTPQSKDRIKAARRRALSAARVQPSVLMTPLPDEDPNSIPHDDTADTRTKGLLAGVTALRGKWSVAASLAGVLIASLVAVAFWTPGIEPAPTPSPPVETRSQTDSLPPGTDAPIRASLPEAADRLAARSGGLLSQPPATETGPQPAQLTTDDPRVASVEPGQPAGVSPDSPARELYVPSGPPDETVGQPSYFTPAPGLLTMAEADDLDNLSEPGLDPDVRTDALALPAPEPSDMRSAPAPLAPPPPLGQTFAVDERGLVAPSPDGAETQDGTVVFEGLPPVATQPRPPLEEPDKVVVTDRDSLAVDDPLRRISPRKRPETLTDRYERNRLGGKTVSELEILRPVVRPSSLQDVAAESQPTALAVAKAPRPNVRSAGKAQLFAARSSAPDGPAIHEDNTVAPKNTTPAKVARQATNPDGIDLSQVNLLGTFGSASKPRALVRLANGRVVNVKVGDRMDGGKVSQIRQGRLVYVKGGQTLTLDMPKG